MQSFIDQTGRQVEIRKRPERIISLVPSQTELLEALGLDEEVVGITKFCIHPQHWFSSKTRVGGTKQVKMEIIQRLKPDLIIANKEENTKEQIEELATDYPVWISDIKNLEEALLMINEIGLITGEQTKAQKIILQIKEGFATLKLPCYRPKSAFIIWKDPYITVSNYTFINAMMEAAGFDNVFKERDRYPEISIDDLKKSDCELLLLSSEPFPFKQKHLDELQSHLPNTKIVLADGEMFSWYGSRLIKAPAYFQQLQNALK